VNVSQETNVPGPLTSSSDDWPDSLQEQIARITAQRAKQLERPDHEDYANFFVPPELAHNVNSAARQRNSPATEIAQVVEVAPKSSGKKDGFDPFTYIPFGLDPEDDPRKHPWPVPVLEIIDPSPPSSIHGDITPPASKTSEASGSLDRKQKRSATITWGEKETHFYEVVPPFEEKDESLATVSPSKSRPGLIPALQMEKPPVASKTLSKSQARKNRRQFESDFPEQSQRALQTQCLDIMQSKWVQDPNDPSEEIVSLTSFRTSLEAASAETSFRWV
jgi:hypothetical protein